MLIFLFFHDDTCRYFGESYRYFFLFKWILGPLQNTYFYVKSTVGFLKSANYFAIGEKCWEFLHFFTFFFFLSLEFNLLDIWQTFFFTFYAVITVIRKKSISKSGYLKFISIFQYANAYWQCRYDINISTSLVNMELPWLWLRV